MRQLWRAAFTLVVAGLWAGQAAAFGHHPHSKPALVVVGGTALGGTVVRGATVGGGVINGGTVIRNGGTVSGVVSPSFLSTVTTTDAFALTSPNILVTETAPSVVYTTAPNYIIQGRTSTGVIDPGAPTRPNALDADSAAAVRSLDISIAALNSTLVRAEARAASVRTSSRGQTETTEGTTVSPQALRRTDEPPLAADRGYLDELQKVRALVGQQGPSSPDAHRVYERANSDFEGRERDINAMRRLLGIRERTPQP